MDRHVLLSQLAPVPQIYQRSCAPPTEPKQPAMPTALSTVLQQGNHCAAVCYLHVGIGAFLTLLNPCDLFTLAGLIGGHPKA